MGLRAGYVSKIWVTTLAVAGGMFKVSIGAIEKHARVLAGGMTFPEEMCI